MMFDTEIMALLVIGHATEVACRLDTSVDSLQTHQFSIDWSRPGVWAISISID